jgi:hypothetical protein
MMSLEIVIVGGGPIGCWTAIQAIRRNPKLQITIYERFENYQRDHIMTIRRKSLAHCQPSGNEQKDFMLRLFRFQSTCSELCGLSKRSGLRGHFGLPRILDIRTIDFERFLKQECKAAGITFIFKHVDGPEELLDAHPNCEHFIVADGANSKMRTKLWGPDCVFRREILPSLDFKYKAIGQPRYLVKSTFPDLAHIGLENIGLKGTDGLTDVNLRFVVSKDDYDAIPPATFKDPLIVTPASPFWKKMSKKRLYGNRTFRDDFYEILRMRQVFAAEKLAETPIRMTKIYLSRYTANEFAKTTSHCGRIRGWFLVGDSAMGMPFYRSVNSGLILGSQLSLLLSQALSISRKVKVYNSLIRPARVIQEFTRTKYLEYKAFALLTVIRPILFHAARVPGLRDFIVRPFDHVARWRGARFP